MAVTTDQGDAFLLAEDEPRRAPRSCCGCCSRLSAGLVHDWVNIGVLSLVFVLASIGILSGEDSVWHTVAIAVMCAYLAGDVVWIAVNPSMVKTPKAILAHHAVTLIVIMDTIESASHRANASHALIVEINTVLLTLRRILGRPLWCEIGFYLTWVGIRLVWFPALGAALLASTWGRQDELAALLAPRLPALLFKMPDPPVRSYASISFAVVVVLQFYWTIVIWQTVKGEKSKPLESKSS
ncbi:unnamed protein product [Polarella glacialis]|uniref:TLC domain-containing protein n=1 Tax=Polarella glacialis TaxID=89957 RepID=A0A813G2R2_POLGL|nr:unnamed protein product [Polarella glacialis]